MTNTWKITYTLRLRKEHVHTHIHTETISREFESKENTDTAKKKTYPDMIGKRLYLHWNFCCERKVWLLRVYSRLQYHKQLLSTALSTRMRRGRITRLCCYSHSHIKLCKFRRWYFSSLAHNPYHFSRLVNATLSLEAEKCCKMTHLASTERVTR